MHDLLKFFNNTLFLYYLGSNLVYLMLLITALVSSTRHRMRLASMKIDALKDSPFTPPISIICPARNEEASIVGSVQALLDLHYPELEVIVVNDGSSDRTLEFLRKEFALYPVEMLYIQQIPSGRVKRLYFSRNEPGLLVLDKVAGGCKADAINAGLNAVNSPYVCVVDADSILEKDALFRIMSRVFSDAHNVVAIGGIVRVLNGAEVCNGQVTDVYLPRRPIEIVQVIEYLRAFLIGREAWASFQMLPIGSGAFGVFQTDVVRRIKGFRASAIGEDLDLVVRMHRDLLDRGEAPSVVFVPDPTCWTEVPSDLRSLAKGIV